MPAARSPIAVVLPVTLAIYAVLVIAARGGTVAGILPALSAGAVAALLWIRHARARFSAYVLLTVIALRGLWGADWAAAVFAIGAILLLQLRAARAAWPRLRPGVRPADSPSPPGDRMSRP